MSNKDPKSLKGDENQTNIYNLNKSKVKKLRSNTNSVLATIFCTGFLAIGITLFSANHSNKEKYQFPEQISLAGWELRSSQNLEQLLQKGAIAARQYIYTSPQQADLEIDMIYVSGITTLPRDLHFLQIPSNLPTKMHYQNTTGHYLTFRYLSRSYLAACINPRGQSTTTEDQFMNNRNSYDITSDRLFLYVIGMADLRDTRCLLTILSIPSSDTNINNQNNLLNNSSIEQDYQKLEAVWRQWHQLWQVNFPMQ